MLPLCLLFFLGDIHGGFPPYTYDTSSRTTQQFSKARAEAVNWLTLIDQQQYSDSWFQGSSLMRDVVSQDQWTGGMTATRQTMGLVTSRSIHSSHTTHTLPFGTKGNFMVIQYATNFSRASNMVETIVLMTDGPNADWKVVSYDITR